MTKLNNGQANAAGEIILEQEHLTFSLIQPHDVAAIQQMIQGTHLSALRVSTMNFNRHALPIFVARAQGNIVGFTCGEKGYGNQAHVMTIRGTYLYNRYNDPQHESELQLALVTWAEKKMNVTHYKLDDLDTVKPISISHMIPAPVADIPTVEIDVSPAPMMSADEPIYAYN